MSQESDLLAAIIERPDDDDLRLIYADWLEEQGGEGNESRAALIRTQIRLHRMGRNDSERSELSSTEQGVAGSTYPTALHTLQLPRNRIGPRGIGALASSPALRSLEILDLTANQIGESGARAIADSPHWQRLSDLDLLDWRIGSEGIVALADSPNLAGVKHLNLQGNTIDHEAARVLARSPHLDRIETLRCDMDVPNQEELEARFGHRVAFC